MSYSFSVTVNLDDFFTDKRSLCKLFISDEEIKTIGDFLIRIRKMFDIRKSIDLFVKDLNSVYFIPSWEDVRILQTNNTVVIKAQCDNSPEQSCLANKKKCKKRKHHISLLNQEKMDISETFGNDKKRKTQEENTEDENIAERFMNSNGSKVESNENEKYTNKVNSSSLKTSQKRYECDTESNIDKTVEVQQEIDSNSDEDNNKFKNSAQELSFEENRTIENIAEHCSNSDIDGHNHSKKNSLEKSTLSVTTDRSSESSLRNKIPFKCRPQIPTMEIATRPKVIKSIKVLDSDLVNNGKINNTLQSLSCSDTIQSTVAKDDEIMIESLRKRVDKLLKERGIGEQNTVCLSNISNSSLQNEKQNNILPLESSTPIINGISPLNGDISLLNKDNNIVKVLEKGTLEDNMLEACEDNQEAMENATEVGKAVGKRRRKRYRSRKKKSQSCKTPEVSPCPRRTYVETPAKAKPLIHIRFDDNDTEVEAGLNEDKDVQNNEDELDTLENEIERIKHYINIGDGLNKAGPNRPLADFDTVDTKPGIKVLENIKVPNKLSSVQPTEKASSFDIDTNSENIHYKDYCTYNIHQNNETPCKSRAEDLRNILNMSDVTMRDVITKRDSKNEMNNSANISESNSCETSSSSSDAGGKIVNLNEHNSDLTQNICKNFSFSEVEILKFPVMNFFPRKGDIIAYKIIVLSEMYTPEISQFFIAKVLLFEEKTNMVYLQVLEGTDQLVRPKGKFSLEDECEMLEAKVSYNLNTLIEPRLLFP